MVDALIEFFSHWPSPLATAVLAAIPITELQLAIPVAMHKWSLTPGAALGYALLGNMVPFFPLYFGLMRLRTFFEKHAPRLVRPLDALLARGEGKVKKQYAKYGAVALFLFTAIPLPLSGIWSATLAAVALKIPFRPAIIGISLGMLVAGIIVTVASVTAEVVLQ